MSIRAWWSLRRLVGAAAVVTSVGTSAPAQTTHIVELLDMSFSPSDLKINLGDTVHWVWVLGFHNVESGVVMGFKTIPDGRFRSGDPNVDLTFDVTFNQAFLDAHPAPGRVYPYYCLVHADMGMIGSISVVECVTDADCSDANVCTDDVCAGGTCRNPQNNVPCDDGNPCTAGDVCSGGVCSSGATVPGCCRTHSDCNDGNVCTNDLCEGGVCRSSPGPAVLCDDGDPCTIDDTCTGGVCIGTRQAVCCRTNADCNDDNECTDDLCNAGACTHSANAALCDDGNPCTRNDVCSGGQCRGVVVPDCCRAADECVDEPCAQTGCVNRRCVRTPLPDCKSCDENSACDDANVCTDDRCVDHVCQNANKAGPCNDGDPCTRDDVCSAGACAGAPIDECCAGPVDCDDGDPCTSDGCVGNACIHTAIAGCGDTVNDNNGGEGEPSSPVPDGQGNGSPPTPRAGMCGSLGMINSFLLLGLGLTRLPLSARRRASSGHFRARPRGAAAENAR